MASKSNGIGWSESYIKGMTLEDIQGITSVDLNALNGLETEQLLKRAGGIVNKRLPALRKAEERYGTSIALEVLNKSGRDRINTSKKQTTNQQKSELKQALQFLRDESGTSSAGSLKETFTQAVYDLTGLNDMPPWEQEAYMRRYLKKKGITRVSKRDLKGRFIAAVPKTFVVDFWAIYRSIEESGKYGKIPSEVLRKTKALYVQEHPEHPDWDVDDWSIWLNNTMKELIDDYNRQQRGTHRSAWGPVI